MQIRPRSVEAAPAPAVEEVAVELGEATESTEVAAEPTDAVAMVDRKAPARSFEVGPAPTREIESPANTPPYAGNSTIVVFAPNIGLGSPKAANPFLRPGALPPLAEAVTPKGSTSADAFYVPENKRAEQSVKDALRARDQSIGLGLEGPVVHALEDATHVGFAPDHGIATFTAVIDEHGLVIDLKVLGTHDAGWDDVRKRAVKSLAAAKIDLRGAKGAQLKIEVSSDVLTAAGSNPNKKIVPTFKPSLTETNAPGMPETKPENGNGTLNAEIATFDVTDAAGKPTRVVHAKLVLFVTR